MKTITSIFLFLFSSILWAQCPATFTCPTTVTVTNSGYTLEFPSTCTYSEYNECDALYPPKIKITVNGANEYEFTRNQCGPIVGYSDTSGNPLPTDDNEDYTYNVEFIDDSDNTVLTCVYDGNTLGFEDYIIKQEVSIYPNPLLKGNIVHVKVPNTTNFEIKLLDITGKTLLSRSFHGEDEVSINFDDIRDGVYIFQIISESSVQTRKLIVNKK